jgi:hypothetical protein
MEIFADFAILFFLGQFLATRAGIRPHPGGIEKVDAVNYINIL